MVYKCKIDTPLGAMLAAAKNEALTGLWFIGQKYFPSKTKTWVSEPDYAVFQTLRAWLADYFAGKNNKPEVPIGPPGTLFQRAVWDILLTIPFGQTTTYGEIAGKIAAARGLPSMSAQAVGGAVGHNPISILIPCHRVIGSNGSLTGYAGGVKRKEALLRLEAGAMKAIVES